MFRLRRRHQRWPTPQEMWTRERLDNATIHPPKVVFKWFSRWIDQ